MCEIQFIIARKHYISKINTKSMKKLLYTLLFFVSLNASATNYYVKNGGNDEADGLSDATAWATIVKVNNFQASLSPGDSVLFRRGDTFFGSMTINKSGTSGNRIVYGAYGSGEKPVITGFETLTSWTDEGGGIYSKAVTCQSKPNFITINNRWFAMGRYPNDEYLIYESFSTNKTITDNELTSEPNWTGAEAVIRKTNWITDRCLITNHTNQTLTYSSQGSSSNGTANYGYFFQNHIRTLDVFGEWYYNGSVLYVYFGAENPDNYTVNVPKVNYLVYNYRDNYITLENTQFTGSLRSNIFMESYADYCVIRNCDVNFSGENGINLLAQVRWSEVDNNTIKHSARAGIYADSNPGMKITNNYILNSGMLLGAYVSGTQNNGIYSGRCDDALIQYNVIDSSAYNGIYFTGNRVQLKNNYIKNSVLLLNDGGGIYTQSLTFSGRVIEENIILNSFGNTSGSGNVPYGEGIYLDSGWSGVSDVSVLNNTVAGCRSNGFNFADAINITIAGNLAYNNKHAVKFQNFANDCSGNTMYDNTFIAKTTDQSTLRVGLQFSTTDKFVNAYNNYYARPVSDGAHMLFWITGTGWDYRTMEDWQTQSGEDADAKGSPFAVADTSMFRFYHNPTGEDVVVELEKSMFDMDGIETGSEITVPAWSSVVLLVEPVDVGISRNKISGNRLMVYPNPASAQLWISVEGSNGNRLNYSIIDIQGRVIMRGVMENTGNGTYTLNTENISPGIYMMHVEVENGAVYNERIVIQNFAP